MKLHGARQMDKVLAGLPRKIRGRVLSNAVMGAAGVIQRAAKQTAPVAGGTLKAEIVRRRRRGGNGVTVQVGPTRDAFWGMFQEFGTKHHAPRPWLRPAFEENKAEALDKMGKSLGRAIEREATRLAGSFAKSGLKARRR
jgi:HK97 gp10 family phage protein